MSNWTKVGGYVACGVAGAVVMWAVDRSGDDTKATALSATSASASSSANAIPSHLAASLQPGPSKREVNPGAVKVDLFVMSQCPYGVQAEALFGDILQKLGPDLDLRVEFIGDISANGQLQSMHGQPEVTGDIAQACAMAHSANWFEFIQCQNTDWKAVDSNWGGCAVKTGIDPRVLEGCIKGPEGQALLTASFNRSRAAQADGSPTIHIAGKDYQGSRRPTDIMRAICSNYTSEAPAACGELPPVVPVNVTILTDARCGQTCELPNIEAALGQFLGKPVVKTIDYSSEEGQKLFKELNPAILPIVVFDKSLEKDPDGFAAIQDKTKQQGDYRVSPLGPEWNPRCADPKGCELAECKDKLVCRKEEPKTLEVFVMSECPFGVKGLDAMKEVLANFDKAGEKLAFKVHYIGNGTAASGFHSLHGQTEIDENTRQLCVMDQTAGSLHFMKYIWCRNKDLRGDWRNCTGADSGLDQAKLESCATGDDGKKLLEKSFKVAEDAGIGSSPTWIVNNKFQFQGIDAETIKTNVCQRNPGMKGCDVTLSSEPPNAGGGDMPMPTSCGG